MMRFLAIFNVLILIGKISLAFNNKLEEIFSWRSLDFNFENEDARRIAIQTRDFIPKNNIPFGIEIWKDKLFVTVPRRNPGVPSTLNFVNLNSNETSPHLNPYPDWKSNNISRKFLISVYRVNVDICDRLWIMDTGSVVDFEGNGERIHAPQIIIFDLKTNNLLKKYVLNSNDYVCNSAYINIVADVTDTCKKTFAYSVDPSSNAMLVYSLEGDESWRIKHSYFSPDPMHTDYEIGELAFQWDDGIFGLSLSEANKYGFRNAYIHSMSSLLEFVIDTEFLRNKTAALTKYNKNFVKILGSRKAKFQAAASTFDEKTGVLFYSLVSQNGIGCWNSKKYKDYSERTNDILVSNNVTMVYFSDVKIDKNENFYGISNRLPIILYDEYRSQDVNFRIFRSSVRHLIKNSMCEVTRRVFRPPKV